jgi:hypothetical protein
MKRLDNDKTLTRRFFVARFGPGTRWRDALWPPTNVEMLLAVHRW